MQRIDIDDPAVDMDGAKRLLYQGELFSGEVAEYHGGSLVSLDGYTEGVPDGLTQEWYRDGARRSWARVRMGFVIGECLEWHRNGQLASKRVFSEDGKRLLGDYKWDEEGKPTRAWCDKG
ncbi:hypothetical protein [Streptomyces sp. NPDC049585]|uniref:toxin-antitoxin system YwqK family antitoxin n=1 Tax=Streptomyces sp. NPDC049585 TaxID=3155154 RepID=UPI00343C831C